jgi:GTP-binding protein
LRDARFPESEIDGEVEKYLSSFIRGDQLYLTVFTKLDKLKQKERNALNRKFPSSIKLSNLKRTGYDRVHKEIFKHIFGIG